MTDFTSTPRPIPPAGAFKTRAPGVRWCVVPIEGATAVYWDFDAGATVPRHNHHHAQFLAVLDGAIDMLFDDQTVTVQGGQVLSIAPFQRHAAVVPHGCKVVDIFVPRREEYEEEYARG